MNLSSLDQIIFAVYVVGVILFGIWIANRDKNATSSDYFLASRSLPWWAVGGSLIASNISAEQIIGMNGSGFQLGIAIATYELMAAITLIIVAKFLLPVFLKKGIFTMPQFLEERFDGRVRSIMSVFWIGLFVFVNIASVMYLGGLAIETLMGFKYAIGDSAALTDYLVSSGLPENARLSAAELSQALQPGTNVGDLIEQGILTTSPNVPMWMGILGLVIYSASFSIFGGLKAVVWTDIVQVVVLLIGGTVAAIGILGAIGDGSVLAGITELFQEVPGHFEMLFEPSDSYVDRFSGETKTPYLDLPGFALLFGGMWIVNTYYWGNNQYIIQRALAAKNLKEAQKGVAFAGFMKLFIPFFAVLPGIAAYYLATKQNADISSWETADEAFPWVLSNYVGPGLRGLTFAALVAAIGSSISSMVNSASTIFTLDIYHKHINAQASERNLVRTGQFAAAGALVIGAIFAPLLGGIDQAFQYIQEYTGFVSPGVFAVFIFGMFWRRTTAKAALVAIAASIPLSALFKVVTPDLPFLDRMAFVFLIEVLLLIGISLYGGAAAPAKSDDAILDDGTAKAQSTMSKLAGGNLLKDNILRLGLSVAVIAIGLVTGIRIILDQVPGVPTWVPVSILVMSVVVIYLLLTEKKADDHKAIDLEPELFKTERIFNFSAIAITLILVAIYSLLA
ncbi:MAG: sodium/solute symporter [Bacteroidota bacterium]